MTAVVENAPCLPTFHETYQGLPQFYDAKKNVNESTLEQVQGPIRQVFVDHDMEYKYGLGLLHRHFSIEENERLVEHGPSTSLWVVDSKEDTVTSVLGLGFIKPRAWRFIGPIAVPYEWSFTREPVDPTFTKADLAFFKELSSLLYGLNLQDVLGIRDVVNLDTKITLEITMGKNSIMVYPRNADKEKNTVALWKFSKDPQESYCDDAGHCTGHCRTK